jgi:hypothetical protein
MSVVRIDNFGGLVPHEGREEGAVLDRAEGRELRHPERLSRRGLWTV